MKKFILSYVVLAMVGCTSSVKNTPQMQGAYFMTSQTVNDGKTDITYTDLKQLKIYTDSFMMYSQVNPGDSLSGFGVGTYNGSDTGRIVENVIYTSHDTTFNTSPPAYVLNITKNPQGYTQVIPEININGQNSKLTEEYQSVGKSQKSPLDGVWKEINAYSVKGNDTTKTQRTQYKAYYDGYFMFGQTVKDSSGKSNTGIGFGSFVMDGDKRIVETDLNSTYAVIAGNIFNIDFTMDGNDKYAQTITDPDGTKGYEFYERMKGK